MPHWTAQQIDVLLNGAEQGGLNWDGVLDNPYERRPPFRFIAQDSLPDNRTGIYAFITNSSYELWCEPDENLLNNWNRPQDRMWEFRCWVENPRETEQWAIYYIGRTIKGMLARLTMKMRGDAMERRVPNVINQQGFIEHKYPYLPIYHRCNTKVLYKYCDAQHCVENERNIIHQFEVSHANTCEIRANNKPFGHTIKIDEMREYAPLKNNQRQRIRIC
ncbi:MAG: hypothetical protein HY730_09830 [Candidatus Tectomicrobia bacterium]|uniref:Uncharacterized protein n=1 Tax=Tectimicrobiota bacterium TaxID=2528274 RepID=A0A933LQY4_UNCTE|nr:hypothetical protein [Candidatus Tectomicrobia bacterium]